MSLSPTIGVYIPTAELVKASNGEEFKQEVSITVGGGWRSRSASGSASRPPEPTRRAI